MRKKILVRGPVLSRSGYGEQTRYALRALRAHENKFDIYADATNWGKTSWIFEDNEERHWIDFILKKTHHYVQQQQEQERFDISLQVTIPNEWQKLAPINIGYTAGIETTKVSPQWIEKSFLMDKIIVISNHAKNIYQNTSYLATDNHTGQEFEAKCRAPIEVVNYPVREFEPTKIDLDFTTDFNFLVIAQWSIRKNIENTIKWFIEEFIDQEVGLVLKVHVPNLSLVGRHHTEVEIKRLLDEYPDKKCKIYFLYGDMNDREMTSLYQHPKIKALISLSHGEGYGLPLFEAAYNGLPVITTDWSGQTDFLHMPVKKKNKIRMRPHFASVKYDISPIQTEAVWDGVLQADSMWCYPQQGSYKMKLREVYKDYGRYTSQAKKLKKYILKEFEAEKMYNKFVSAIIPEPVEATEKIVTIS